MLGRIRAGMEARLGLVTAFLWGGLLAAVVMLMVWPDCPETPTAGLAPGDSALVFTRAIRVEPNLFSYALEARIEAQRDSLRKHWVRRTLNLLEAECKEVPEHKAVLAVLISRLGRTLNIHPDTLTGRRANE